jgi:predicted nucleic acid-binding protein
MIKAEMSKVVSNTSPLIALSAIKRLDLLYRIFPSVIIPQGVWNEIVSDGTPWSSATAIREALSKQAKWAEIVSAPQLPLLATLSQRLGIGEAEAIVLAVERNLPVLLDDKAARKAGNQLGLSVIGTLAILARSKENGEVPQVKPLLLGILDAGIYLAKPLVDEFLRSMGEI